MNTRAATTRFNTTYAIPPIYRTMLVKERAGVIQPTEIRGQADAIKAAEGILSGLDREHFAVIAVNAKNGVIGAQIVHIGTLTASLVGPREVFRAALLLNASAIIVAHNHPSGDPTPSEEDKEVTQSLKRLGAVLDIPLLDHIVVGDGSSVSFAKEGLL